MVYTVTFNPALDYIISVDSLQIGGLNRATSEQVLAGGKGINVSIVLNNLGIENKALGFIAGFSGEKINQILEDMKCNTDFIAVKEGMSRINIKIKTNEETEINGIGPQITTGDIDELLKKLSLLNEDDILVLAGSVPNGINSDIYADIMKKLKAKNVKIVVDSTKDLLLNSLEYKPFLIKPNKHELGELFGIDINDNEIDKYALKLKDMGARNIIVSLGKDGAIGFFEDGKIIKVRAPKGKLINSVGAGDSMIAGFISGYLEDKNLENSLKKAVATGSASAFSINLATKKEVDNLINDIEYI